MDSQLEHMTIDLGVSRRKELNEFVLTALGGQIELLMRRLFGGGSIPVSIRGTSNEINAFTKALSHEKKYMEAYTKYGLDNPRTFKNRYSLESAVKDFERQTGIKWPFK